MATLRFRGTGFCDLIDTLAEATRASAAGECPSIEINEIVYAPHVLAAIAALLPETALSAQHQAVVDKLIATSRPTTYRRAAESLARRAGEVVAQARVGKPAPSRS
jgi:hypothetical protein